MINSLVLQEAKDSSTIEDIITTYDELFLAQIDEIKIAQSAKEVMNYEIALKKGYSLIKKDNLFLTRHILEFKNDCNVVTPDFAPKAELCLKIPPQAR